MELEGNLTCSVNIEWMAKNGTVTRKVTHKSADLRVIRNGSRALFIEVSAAKSAPTKLELKGISVYKNFMNEGKASIKFEPLNCSLYISNAPTSQLLGLLKTMFVKMTGVEPQKKTGTPLRNQILSGKINKFDEISPLSNLELEKARAKAAQISKASATTPSPQSKKRKLSDRDGSIKGPAAKKLYASTPLNPDQQDVLNACLSGRNVFFTGSAGTGKSFLLKKIIGALPPDVTSATASTGVAACQIGGITLHQFAGIGRGDASIDRCVALAQKPPTVTILRKCRHLIIDEISMVDGEYFEKIEEVARRVRKNDKPFGGIQLIFCGDFFQLPPVSKQVFGTNNKTPKASFCFQTKAWKACQLNTYELKQVHRQNDNKFITILNNIRKGTVDQDTINILTETGNNKIERDGILATVLCTHTKDAEILNTKKISELKGETVIFEAQDSVPGSTKQLDMQTPVPSKLELKIDAQVMLLKNINVASGLVNGARGVVTSFKNGFPVIKFRNKKEYVPQLERWTVKTSHGGTLTRKQIPLKLAWAFSIHKSQGLTLDCVEMSLSRVFEAGQAYVALSRAQSLDSLRVINFRANQVWANPDVINFYKNIDYYQIIPLGPKNINKSNGAKSEGKKKGPKFNFNIKPLVNIC